MAPPMLPTVAALLVTLGYSAEAHWPPPCKENWHNCDLMEDRISCQLRLCPWSHEPLLPASGMVSDWYGCTKVGDQVDCYLKNLGAPAPWPSCDLLYNWYSCRGHHEGGIICGGIFKRDSVEPIAIKWTRSIEFGNQSHIPGQDDFGFLYNVNNFEGRLKLSLRFCFQAERGYLESSDWHHKGPPPCKENWYNCNPMEDSVACQLRLCPWSHEPLLPLSGKVADWYGCTKVGDQVDCYLNNLGERKIHHHGWPHEEHPGVPYDYFPHSEYAGMEYGYGDMIRDDL